MRNREICETEEIKESFKIQNNRDKYIDSTKTIALMLVLALHTQRSLATGTCYNPILYYFARCSMPLFFMVNGSLILRKSEFSKTYFVKKTANIIRVLAIWGVLLAIYSFTVRKTDILESLKNGVKGSLAHFVIPFWFLYTFVFLYVVLLFFHSKIKASQKKILWSLVILSSAMDVISIIMIIRGGYFVQAKIPQMFRIWTWLLYFVLGHYLSMIDISILRIRKHFIVFAAIVLSIACTIYQYYLCSMYLGRINSEYCYDNVSIIIWCSSIFLCLRLYEDSLVEKKLASLSKYGFGAFLLHPIFIDAFHLTDKVTNGMESLVLWVALIIVCWTISWIVSKIPYVREAFRY